MSESPKQHEPDPNNTVTLEIMNPTREGGNFFVRFRGDTERVCEAYNEAIWWALHQVVGAWIYHQFGGTSEKPNPPGDHGWEICDPNITIHDLEILLPAIEVRAQEILMKKPEGLD